MINIAVCDDNEIWACKMEKLLEGLCKKNFMEAEIEVFFNGKELADAVNKGILYDIIFLDIEMKEENGLLAAKRIRTVDKVCLIIFVTSHENYMREVFDVRPFRFLNKPVTLEVIQKCLLESYDEIINTDCYFRYKYERAWHKVNIKDIIYFESQRRKIYIQLKQKKLEMYSKLNDVEEEMTQKKITFLRIHQSYLINYIHIETLRYDHVILDNGDELPISEDRRQKISEQYSLIE